MRKMADLMPSCRVQGIAALRDHVYVVFGSDVIRIFDSTSLRLLDQIVVSENGAAMWAMNIAASTFSNCLYVSDSLNSCIWCVDADKMKGYQWMETRAKQYADALCVTSQGKLVFFSDVPKLDVYGQDARLALTIQLPSDVTQLRHVVETSSGNFVIAYGGGTSESPCRISEVSITGQMIRSFDGFGMKDGIPLGLCQVALGDGCVYMYVADFSNHRLLVLDGKLTVSRELMVWSGTQSYCPLRILHLPGKNSLLVGLLDEVDGYSGCVHQYSLSFA